MITKRQRMRNLHNWIRLGWARRTVVEHKSDASADVGRSTLPSAAIFESFRAELALRMESHRHTSSIVRQGFVNDNEVEPLTPKLAKTLSNLFGAEGLSIEILEAEPVQRGQYVVLANISFRNGRSMSSFLDEIFADSPIIETACSVFGNHDCIFTLWASQQEIEYWLWTTLRESYLGIGAVTTMTYQTYSNVRNRFDMRKHPDYDAVLYERLQYGARQARDAAAMTSATDTESE